MSETHRILAIVQARMGSSRLPGKALLDLAGKPLIQHVLERVAMSRVHHVALAVPVQDVAVMPTGPWSIVGFPGIDDADVLTRFLCTAACFPWATAIMRVTGDCPLWDSGEGDRVIDAFEQSGCDYASNLAFGYCDGEDVEIIRRSTLEEADRLSQGAWREHVTPAIRRGPSLVTVDPTWPCRRKTSVDTAEDYAYIKALVEGPQE